MHYLIENTNEAAFILQIGSFEALAEKQGSLIKEGVKNISLVDQRGFDELYDLHDEDYLTKKEPT